MGRPRRRCGRRRLVVALVGLTALVVGCLVAVPGTAAGDGLVEWTAAAWTDRELLRSTLTAGTVSPPTGLTCSAGLLSNVRFMWAAPTGGVTRTGYTWALSGGLSGGGTLAPTATSVTIPTGLLSLIATGTFTLVATGPGTWTSTVVTGHVSVTGALGIPLATGCSVP